MSAVIDKIGKAPLKDRVCTEASEPRVVPHSVVMGGAPIAG